MHEICALLYYVFSHSEDKTEEVEAMTYACFTAFIMRFRDWFDKECDNKSTGLNSCFKNITTVLRAYDSILYNYLEDNGMDATCYCFRWVSMFFIDDYSFDSVIQIWDVLMTGFDSQEIFNIIISVCISMIVDHRDKLLKEDPNTCLKELMNGSHNVEEILERAYKINKFIAHKHLLI